jgi:hypothetical protein
MSSVSQHFNREMTQSQQRKVKVMNLMSLSSDFERKQSNRKSKDESVFQKWFYSIPTGNANEVIFLERHTIPVLVKRDIVSIQVLDGEIING